MRHEQSRTDARRAGRSVFRRLARFVLAFFGSLVVGYVVTFVRFHLGTPTVSHDYLADVNARAAAARPEESAWPLYREAIAQIGQDGPIQPSAAVVFYSFGEIGPDDPLLPDALAYIERATPALDLVREGARRAKLGLVVGYDTEHDLFGMPPCPELGPLKPGIDSSLLNVLLPQLGVFRSLARTLVFEARITTDPDRRTEDLLSLFQLSRQTREVPMLINDLVAIAIAELACNEIQNGLARDPGMLSSEQLERLASAITSWGEGYPNMQLQGERAVFGDTLQRTFTDNGNGSGRITAEGFKTVKERDIFANGLVGAVMKPIVAAGMASRAEHSRAFNAIMDSAERVIAAEPWERDDTELALMSHESRTDGLRMPLVELFTPSFGKAIWSEMHCDTTRHAALIAIALELYRREHGAYPASLDALAPRFLPSVPRDPFDGQPLRYELRDGVACVWSIGADRKDDGGQPTPSGREMSGAWTLVPRGEIANRLATEPDKYDGDWLLLPPPPEAFVLSSESEDFQDWLRSNTPE
ncbi:MAG: hypothetical protein RBS39_05485 [Phycisphaerales bacterium]|jgi:hypothetical protein|nr:hypothetical protein [Phycisphaerales bacterium]